MAQRINISIPDELHAELEKWREQLNVSGICQEALRKEVARLEAVATAGGDLDAVVKRLRAEKDEWEKHWYEVGIQLGHEWARRAPYQRLLEWEPIARPAPEDAVALVADSVSVRIGSQGWMTTKDGERLMAAYPSLRHVIFPAEALVGGYYLKEYNAQRLGGGWLKGVRDLWKRVKTAL
jgi:post-segregation antitoxin (ccd killing protein)